MVCERTYKVYAPLATLSSLLHSSTYSVLNTHLRLTIARLRFVEMSSYLSNTLQGARNMEQGADDMEAGAERMRAAGLHYQGMLDKAAWMRNKAQAMRSNAGGGETRQDHGSTWSTMSGSFVTAKPQSRGTESRRQLILTDNSGTRTLDYDGTVNSDENDEMWFFNPVYEGGTLVSREEKGRNGRVRHVLLSKAEREAAASESATAQSVNSVAEVASSEDQHEDDR